MIELRAGVDVDDPKSKLRRTSEGINTYSECIGAHLPLQLPLDTYVLLGTGN